MHVMQPHVQTEWFKFILNALFDWLSQMRNSAGAPALASASTCVMSFSWVCVQDLLVASLFRNFLLAERIMRAANCTPASFPRLPPTHQHPMWQAWDMAAEMCLLQLPP